MGWNRTVEWNYRYRWYGEDEAPNFVVLWYCFIWGGMYGQDAHGTELKMTEQDKAWYKPIWNGL